MQEHSAATSGDTRAGVVVDLNNEVIEMIRPHQSVGIAIRRKPDRLVVAAIGRVLAPAVVALVCCIIDAAV